MLQQLEVKENGNNLENKNEIHVTFYSAFFFLTNVLMCVYFQDYLYATLFFILFITSIIVHGFIYNIYKNILDKLAILLVVSYGGYTMYKKCNPTTINLLTLLVNICFISTIYIYISKQYSINLHVLLHLLSSIGHHLILFL